MECSSCGALIDAGDRFCPACCLPNMAGSHHPKFGPPEREPSPLFVDRVVGPGLRPCPRCADGIRASDHYCRSCGLDLADLAPLPPPGRTVGVWTTPGPEGDDWYRSTAVSSAAVRLVLGAVALVGACVVANSLLIYQALGGWIPILGSAGPHPNWADLQNWSGNLAALQLVLIALATVLVIAWTRRTYRNLPALNVIDLRLRPAWAMWGWLIPGVNLVLPKRVVDDTWRASDPTDAPYAPGESGWQRHPTPTIHHLWWICTLVALPLVVLTELQLSLAGSLPPATTAGIHAAQMGELLLACSQALLLFAAVLLTRIVGSIYERQRDRADAIGPVSPATQPWRAGSGPGDQPASPEADTQPATTSVFVHALDAEAIGRY